jgi:RNA polymerase sigma-70 factor, ECF subfamily
MGDRARKTADPDGSGAEDVAGETWLQVVPGLAGFHGEERSFRAWLFTIARHRAADWGRARARRPTVPLDTAAGARGLTSPDTADVVLERMSTRAVLAAIAELPRDQGEIIMLRVVAGLDTADVARLVGKSPAAVRAADASRQGERPRQSARPRQSEGPRQAAKVSAPSQARRTVGQVTQR